MRIRYHFPTRFRCLLFLLGMLAGAARAEYMREFDATIQINADASFNVVETIRMDFQGTPRHGIFRMIPWRYNRGGRRVTTDVENINVTDERGGSLQHKTSRQGAYWQVRIGDPDRTITGRQTYRISYKVRRALPTFDNRPELYWNVSGDKWPYPIQTVTARVYPPPGVPVRVVQVKSYVGAEGSTAGAGMQRQADHIRYFTKNLYPGQGLTIVASLPPGSVRENSSDKAARAMDSLSLGALFPLLTLGLLFRRWFNTGRDADAGKPAAIEWDPPKDLSPAEVGTLVDEKCDMADIVSTVVDLAVRGYLRIEEHETKKFLFLSSKDYTFIRTDPPAGDTLAPHEMAFLKGLFGSVIGGQDMVQLSELKEKFYTHLPGIRKAIYESLTKRAMFTSNPETTRNTYLAGGFILAGLAGASLFFLPGAMVPLRVGLIIAGVFIVLSARAMPAKTAAGSAALRQALGFQRFVRATEKDRIAVLAQNDPTLFGRLLPYAMVLGVADQWAEAFRDLLREPPSWYTSSSYGYGHPFSPHAFISDLGSGMQSMGSTFSSSPSSSGGSGMSGGSSGGGFGGGGGGSW